MPLIAKPTRINEASLRTVETFAKRFVIRPDGCWEWIGSTRGMGYGAFTVKDRPRLAHRIMWELVGNPVDFNLQLDHLCENKLCVNPEHLEQVTAGVNAMRSPVGSTINAYKTHCVNGHELTPGSYYIDRRNKRLCKICTNKYMIEYKRKHNYMNEYMRKRRLKLKAEATLKRGERE